MYQFQIKYFVYLNTFINVSCDIKCKGFTLYNDSETVTKIR